MRYLVALSLAIAVSHRCLGPSVGQQSVVAGCYRFDRPLGPSGTGDLERAMPAWYAVELREGGGVGRPQLARRSERAQWERASSWRQRGDTVFLRVFTGLQGWDVTLTPAAGGFAGEARYLSDALAVGWEPPRYPVRATREQCPVAAPPRS
jgi:hypothetical protein